MSDDFDDLPDSADPAAETEFLSVDDIRNKISEKLYNELTGGDDTVTRRAIEDAEIFERSLLALARKKFWAASCTQRMIGKSLTVYELFLYNGDSRGAQKFLQEAMELIKANYGDVDAGKTAPPPAGAIKKPERKGKRNGGAV